MVDDDADEEKEEHLLAVEEKEKHLCVNEEKEGDILIYLPTRRKRAMPSSSTTRRRAIS